MMPLHHQGLAVAPSWPDQRWFPAADGGLLPLIDPPSGMSATAAIASGNHWTPVMNTTLVLVAPFVGIAVGVLAGCHPAIRAARITPMAALRP
jgi:ABC-type antimicrobial peptide transport system permease subunit